jgi:hypothetical protein
MRITVMTQLAKGLRSPSELSATLTTQLQRLKWFLWHGNTFHALQIIDDLTCDLEVEDPPVGQSKLAKAVREFGGYITANTGRIPNYGERCRAGETISTAFVESTVNQVISKRMVKNSRCAGAPAEPTCSSKSAPGSSTTPSPTTTDAGTPTSPTPQINNTRPRNLPRFFPLSLVTDPLELAEDAD